MTLSPELAFSDKDDLWRSSVGWMPVSALNFAGTTVWITGLAPGGDRFYARATYLPNPITGEPVFIDNEGDPLYPPDFVCFPRS